MFSDCSLHLTVCIGVLSDSYALQFPAFAHIGAILFLHSVTGLLYKIFFRFFEIDMIKKHLSNILKYNLITDLELFGNGRLKF